MVKLNSWQPPGASLNGLHEGPLQSKPGVINYHNVTPLGSTPFLFIHILAGTR